MTTYQESKVKQVSKEWIPAESRGTTWTFQLELGHLQPLSALLGFVSASETQGWIILEDYQAPPSMGFSRQEYWSGVPLPSPV